ALVELRAVRVLQEWHADQLAVRPVAPAVVRAEELDGIALVVAAHLHAAVPARVEEDVQPAAAVAAQDHRLLAHRGHEEVAGLRDLALVADHQPRAGEHLLLLLPVELLADEDLAADHARIDVDQVLELSRAVHGHSPALSPRY